MKRIILLALLFLTVFMGRNHVLAIDLPCKVSETGWVVDGAEYKIPPRSFVVGEDVKYYAIFHNYSNGTSGCDPATNPAATVILQGENSENIKEDQLTLNDITTDNRGSIATDVKQYFYSGFSKAGSYDFQVKVIDRNGNTIGYEKSATVKATQPSTSNPCMVDSSINSTTQHVGSPQTTFDISLTFKNSSGTTCPYVRLAGVLFETNKGIAVPGNRVFRTASTLARGKSQTFDFKDLTLGSLLVDDKANATVNIVAKYLFCSAGPNSNGSGTIGDQCSSYISKFLENPQYALANDPVMSLIRTSSGVPIDLGSGDASAGKCADGSNKVYVCNPEKGVKKCATQLCAKDIPQGTLYDINQATCNTKCASAPDPTGGQGGPGGGAQPAPTTFDFSIDNPLGSGYENIEDLLNGVLAWITRLSIPIAVLMILYAGIMFLTSGQYPKNFEKGKTILSGVVIGLAIIFIGKGFISLIKSIIQLKG